VNDEATISMKKKQYTLVLKRKEKRTRAPSHISKSCFYWCVWNNNLPM